MYSKLKTFVGIGILVFYYSENTLFPITIPILLIGVLFFSWYVIEELFSHKRKEKKKSIQAYSDIILGTVALFFIVRFLLAHQLEIAVFLLSIFTLMLIAILIFSGFIKIVKRT